MNQNTINVYKNVLLSVCFYVLSAETLTGLYCGHPTDGDERALALAGSPMFKHTHHLDLKIADKSAEKIQWILK